MVDLDRKQVLRLFDQINVWKRGGQRAPHKPLLLLYALSKCARDGEREIPYAEVDEKLKPLLEEFGPARKSYHTEYPFWRLQNDGIWELSDTAKLERRSSNTDAK
jgi:putative restriction endonuclease